MAAATAAIVSVLQARREMNSENKTKQNKTDPYYQNLLSLNKAPHNTFALISLFRIQSYGHTGWELWSFILDSSMPN